MKSLIALSLVTLSLSSVSFASESASRKFGYRQAERYCDDLLGRTHEAISSAYSATSSEPILDKTKCKQGWDDYLYSYDEDCKRYLDYHYNRYQDMLDERKDTCS